MSEDPKDPAKRMRKLLGGAGNSPMTRLPKKDDAAVSFLPQHEDLIEQPHPQSLRPVPSPAPSKPASAAKGSRFKVGPAFWTMASILSLSINIILVIILFSVVINISRLEIGSVWTMGNGLLGGLYTNFEKMDRAHIATNVQLNTSIPVKFDLQLDQQTTVVLSQDVTIDNAVVTVKTGGLNITNALTTIVLPQGTTLPIVLNLTVPVDTSVPVTLNVPVDIPLNQTQLHEPFTGLQEVIKPFYCMINRQAVNLDGQPVCR